MKTVLMIHSSLSLLMVHSSLSLLMVHSTLSLLMVHSSLSSPLPLLGAFEGSTDEEELFNSTSASPSPSSPFSEPVSTPATPHVNADALKRVEDFLRDNTLLVLVTITLLFLALLVLCGAFFMSRKRKFNAYYPASFPSRMYVDHRDKTGGAQSFSDAPGKSALQSGVEAVDTRLQLQVDIRRAARALRGGRAGETGQAEELLPCLPEEREPGQLSISETSAGTEESSSSSGSQDESVHSYARPQFELDPEPRSLQLIQGEKTAF